MLRWRGIRGPGTIAVVLLVLLAALLCAPCIGSLNVAAVRESSDVQVTHSMLRDGEPLRTLTRTPPFRWQSTRPTFDSTTWFEDSLPFSTPTSWRTYRVQPQTAGLSHPPIYIQNDSDFADQALAKGWPGNGTAVNPYIIEGLDIDATNATGCIRISHTTVHFSIRHCYLRGGSLGWYDALVLNNVSNGEVLNNTCTNGNSGIVILSSTRIRVAYNNCSNHAYSAILVSVSNLTTILNNTCFGNSYSDIFLDYSRQNDIVDNTCSSPISNIVLIGSGDNSLVNNSMTGGGLLLYGYSPFECRQKLVMGNTVNAEPLLFWQDQVGGTAPSSFGQAVLVNCSQVTIGDATVTGCYAAVTLCSCTEITITNLLLIDNQYGLVLYNCSEGVVTNNAFFESGLVAISIQNSSFHNVVGNNTCIGAFTAPDARCIELSSSENILWNNTCSDTPLGIFVVAGYSNTIGGSWITNTSVGILLSPEAGGNLVEGNVFTANAYDAIDDSATGNTFDWNYWPAYQGSDWDGNGIGDSAYLVPGDAYSLDLHPLMLPPGSPVTWLTVPTDQYYPYGYYILYDLDATATPPGISEWWLSDTSFFTVDRFGVVTNRFRLPVGTYWVQVWVSDWMGNWITAGFKIIVYDGTTTTTTIIELPVVALILGTVAFASTVVFVSLVGIVLLRQRRTIGPPLMEPIGDKRPPVEQWNARCPLCGSHLFGDEGFCPGCGNRVAKTGGG